MSAELASTLIKTKLHKPSLSDDPVAMHISAKICTALHNFEQDTKAQLTQRKVKRWDVDEEKKETTGRMTGVVAVV